MAALTAAKPVRALAMSMVALVSMPGTSQARTASDWRPYVLEASTRFGIPVTWIERVIAVESGGRAAIDGVPIRSPKGAIGLMQIMPATWRELRTVYALGSDSDDPRDNILAGTAYLRLMYDRFGYPALFAAYNAGPNRYAAALAGRALPTETRTYVAAITSALSPVSRTAWRQAAMIKPMLFAVLGPPTLTASDPDGQRSRTNELFAIDRRLVSDRATSK